MAFASWSLLRPLKNSAPLAGSPTTRVDFIGVVVFHSFKLRPGRALSLLRGLGILINHYAADLSVVPLLPYFHVPGR